MVCTLNNHCKWNNRGRMGGSSVVGAGGGADYLPRSGAVQDLLFHRTLRNTRDCDTSVTEWTRPAGARRLLQTLCLSLSAYLRFCSVSRGHRGGLCGIVPNKTRQFSLRYTVGKASKRNAASHVFDCFCCFLLLLLRLFCLPSPPLTRLAHHAPALMCVRRTQYYTCSTVLLSIAVLVVF